ncbi:MAG: hypothetical protein U9R28_00265 [Pseudomonadota bacterium]|nr:hypothetical protein [Pseudomonadota bacterium]
MVNIDNPVVNRLWDTSTSSTNDKKSDLSTLLQAKQDADRQVQLANQKVPGASDDMTTSDQGRVMASRMQQFEHAYQYSETMSIQMTTQEGDEVTLDFRQMYAEYQSYKEEQQGEMGPQGVRYFESREAMEMTAFEERFAFSVEGDLNEAELGAIFDVFEQVDALASDFYEGDLEVALQKAVELNIDYGQLQSMSLSMTQSSVEVTRYQQEAMAQYQQMQDQIEDVAQAVEGSGQVSDLPPYLQQWQATISRLEEQFQQAQAIMDRIMAKVLDDRFPQTDEAGQPSGWLERVQEFHQRLLEMAQSQTSSDEMQVDDVTEETVEQVVEATPEALEAEENVNREASETPAVAVTV